jgi:hypothetical protein
MEVIFMKKKKYVLIMVMALTIFTLTGCVPGDGTITLSDPAGFFWGIWHGWIAPVSLIMSLFKDNIRIYETINSGWWYDFGFYIAIISGFGGISLFRKKESKK